MGMSIALASVALFYVVFSGTARALSFLHLMPEKRGFVELYFNDDFSFTQTYLPHVSFSFTLHNLEGQERPYHYRVYVESETGKQTVVDENTLTLLDQHTERLAESFTSPYLLPIMVVVEMPERSQKIHWLIPA